MTPDHERWVHTPEVQADLEESFAWAATTPPQETDLNELEERLLHELHPEESPFNPV